MENKNNGVQDQIHYHLQGNQLMTLLGNLFYPQLILLPLLGLSNDNI
jgi:hypothetical protein